MLYMSAKNIQAMAFTHIMAMLTRGRSVEDHLNLSTEIVCVDKLWNYKTCTA